LQYFNSLNTIYYYFESYYINKSEFKKENTEIYEILKNIDKEYKLSKLINSIIKGENERQLVNLFGFVNLNDKMLFIYIVLCLINNKTKIIFEYNESSLSIFIDLFKILKLFYEDFYQKVTMDNKLNKILHIKL
jgi:hypothetical protein